MAPPSTGTDFFSISNVGTEDLQISAAVQSGSTAFVILNDLAGETLEVGGSKTVYVYYQPENQLGDEGEITFESNDPDEPQYTVQLRGNYSDGGGDSGGGGDDVCYEGDSAVEFVLPPGCELPIDVTFAPADVDDRYNALTVYSLTQATPEDWVADGPGDEYEPDYYSDYLHERVSFYVHGEGLRGDGQAVVTPRSVDFGHLWPGQVGVEYISVNNAGEAPLEFYLPTLDSACDPAFSVTYHATDGAVIDPDTSSVIEVSFTPDDDRDAYCTLYVQTDDPDTPSISVSLQGNVGTDPENEAPRVSILSPEPGYVHGTSADLEMTIALSDANQPVTTLNCRVRSAIIIGGKVADCTPDRETGAVTVSISMEYFDPGVDTLQVEALDDAGASGWASIPVIIQSRAETSDDDGDGFGDAEGLEAWDCDDQYIYTYPEAAEIYDNRDNDCDNLVDEGTENFDDDGDRFSEAEGDCNDFDVHTYPGAPEDTDNRDNDCDGDIDEGTALFDDDGDGFADINNDCDDRDPEFYPGATEYCDGADNDCNGVIDDNCVDLDTVPMQVGILLPAQTSVEEGESTQVSVVFYERDGDDLTWSWDGDAGEFLDPAAPSTATWSAPELEDATVGQRVQLYARVEDDDGNQAWAFGSVDVYPSGTLYKEIEIEEQVGEQSTCASVRGAPLGLLAVFGLLVVAVRRED